MGDCTDGQVFERVGADTIRPCRLAGFLQAGDQGSPLPGAESWQVTVGASLARPPVQTRRLIQAGGWYPPLRSQKHESCRSPPVILSEAKNLTTPAPTTTMRIVENLCCKILRRAAPQDDNPDRLCKSKKKRRPKAALMRELKIIVPFSGYGCPARRSSAPGTRPPDGRRSWADSGGGRRSATGWRR